jgi:hypothetical protein
MKLSFLLSTLCAVAAVSAQIRVAKVFIQPVRSGSIPPSPLADVEFDVTIPSTAKVTSFEAPEIPEDVSLVRIGLYEPKSARWLSSTSVASAENFSKGYSPTIMLSVDAKGSVIGVSCRGVRIDAGQTRDFGPQALVTVSVPGKQPELNKPVVLSAEGKKVVQEEKSFLQKYRLVGPIIGSSLLTKSQVLVVNRGGCTINDGWGWRRFEIRHPFPSLAVSLGFELSVTDSLFIRFYVSRLPLGPTSCQRNMQLTVCRPAKQAASTFLHTTTCYIVFLYSTAAMTLKINSQAELQLNRKDFQHRELKLSRDLTRDLPRIELRLR